MRVIFLLTTSLERPLGFGRIWPIAKEMAKLGYSPGIVALHHNLTSDTPLSYTQEGVEVFYAGQMHVRKTGLNEIHFNLPTLLWLTARATVKMAWLTWRLKPDVIHVCKPHPMNGMAGWIVSRLWRKPLFLDYDDYEAGSNRFSGRWQQVIVRFFENNLPRLAQGCTTNTRFSMKRLQNLGVRADRIQYVPNGVDRERFTNLKPGHSKKIRQELGLTGKRIVMYFGSMRETSHPVDLLLTAFAKLNDNNGAIDLNLLLMGNGSAHNRLRELAASLNIADQVLFLEPVAPDQVPYYLQLAEVTVDPVLNDETARARSPLKIFESLACGIPVVTGDVGDRRQALGDGRYGVLVKPGCPDALAEGLKKILSDHDMRQQMGHDIIQDRHKIDLYWDQLVSSFIRVYQR